MPKTVKKSKKAVAKEPTLEQLMDLDAADNLLERAARALAERRQLEKEGSGAAAIGANGDGADDAQDEDADADGAVAVDAGVPGKGKKEEVNKRIIALRRIKLKADAPRPKIFKAKSTTGPIRLNPANITLKPAPQSPPAKTSAAAQTGVAASTVKMNGVAKTVVDLKVDKGLAKTTEVERLLMHQRKEVVAPELDHDAKTKAKMAKAAETTGSKWYNMPAPELTPALKRDLALIAARSALDPKRHYKKSTTTVTPKFFSIGTIVNTAEGHHSGRLTRRERGHGDSVDGSAGIVDEIMKDTGVRSYLKNKFGKLQKASAERFAPYRRPTGKGKKGGKSSGGGRK